MNAIRSPPTGAHALARPRLARGGPGRARSLAAHDARTAGRGRGGDPRRERAATPATVAGPLRRPASLAVVGTDPPPCAVRPGGRLNAVKGVALTMGCASLGAASGPSSALASFRAQLHGSPSIRHDVREDQREREEHKTEEKVEKEAVSLPARNPGGPERDRNPNDEEQDRAEPPTVRRDEHSGPLVGRCTMQHLGFLGRGRQFDPRYGFLSPLDASMGNGNKKRPLEAKGPIALDTRRRTAPLAPTSPPAASSSS